MSGNNFPNNFYLLTCICVYSIEVYENLCIRIIHVKNIDYSKTCSWFTATLLRLLFLVCRLAILLLSLWLQLYSLLRVYLLRCFGVLFFVLILVADCALPYTWIGTRNLWRHQAHLIYFYKTNKQSCWVYYCGPFTCSTYLW